MYNEEIIWRFLFFFCTEICKQIWDSHDELVDFQKLGIYRDPVGLLGNLSRCNRSALFDFSNRISALLPTLNAISVNEKYTKGQEFGASNYYMSFKGLSVLRIAMILRLRMMYSAGIIAKWVRICENFCHDSIPLRPFYELEREKRSTGFEEQKLGSNLVTIFAMCGVCCGICCVTFLYEWIRGKCRYYGDGVKVLSKD